MKPLARREQILAEAVGSELVLYDQRVKKAHRLNSTAAFLWQHCDGARSVPDLAKVVHEEMGLPLDEDLVLLALEQLQKQGLLQVCSVAAGVSRREALKRMKLLGVAAAMIPVVATIVVPPPAAAASRSSDPTRTGTNTFFDDPLLKRRPADSEGGDKSKPDNDQLGPWR